MPVTEPILPAPSERYRFSLEPVHNGLTSLMLLNRVEQLSGLGEWVVRTAEGLPPELLHRNRVVFEGLHYAVMPAAAHASFPTYLDALAAADPAALRDRLLENLLTHTRAAAPGAAAPASPGELLGGVEAYLGFLEHHFAGHFDRAIEVEAYGYLTEPERMRALIVGHLRALWSEHLAPEWGRVRDQLGDAIAAFRQLDLGDKTPKEAVEAVVGRPPDEKVCAAMERARTVIFVPSPHLGRYVTKLLDGPTLRLFFGARLAAGIAAGPELSRTDLLVRLGAMADDTRLRVLALLAHEGELCAPELMERLELHQSAVSRHLRQLVATGYASERWRDGSKCYTLNRARIDDTLRALERFLG